jgi:hypothetical protein
MRAGHRRYAEAIKHAGADEVIIPEYEGGPVVARLRAVRGVSAEGHGLGETAPGYGRSCFVTTPSRSAQATACTRLST